MEEQIKEKMDFPSQLLTKEQRIHGGIAVHITIAIYTCYALALICENYFVPSLHIFVKKLGLARDIAGATLMAFGSSAPGLFLSIIGTFVTDDDLGLGNIIGSCVFNIYAIIGVCGLLTKQVIPLDWWPITRDLTFYVLSLILLAVSVKDSKIYWFESLSLLTLYVFYLTTLYFDAKLRKFVKSSYRYLRETQPTDANESISESTTSEKSQPVTISIESDKKKNFQAKNIHSPKEIVSDVKDIKSMEIEMVKEDDDKTQINESHQGLLSWTMPKNSIIRQLFWILTLPITLMSYILIIDCRRAKFQKFFIITFVASILLIGVLTYVVSWMVTIIGTTFKIDDAIMGYTALAIGTSMPDMFCSLAVAKQGHGNMALSNGMGSNILDILVNLSVPWLIRSLMSCCKGFVPIETSDDIFYTITFMISSIAPIYILFACYRFNLNNIIASVSLFIYISFLVGSVLISVLL